MTSNFQFQIIEPKMDNKALTLNSNTFVTFNNFK